MQRAGMGAASVSGVLLLELRSEERRCACSEGKRITCDSDRTGGSLSDERRSGLQRGEARQDSGLAQSNGASSCPGDVLTS